MTLFGVTRAHKDASRARALTASHPNALLAFWSIMFHYGHSQFLISFFPVDTSAAGGVGTESGMSTYVEVMRRYWTFLPAAFLTERAAFMKKPFSVEDVSAASIAASKGGNSARARDLMWAPYRNVARMHMLIFFFFIAHFARLENFAVYTVVYAAYFLPWRLVRRSAMEPTPA